MIRGRFTALAAVVLLLASCGNDQGNGADDTGSPAPSPTPTRTSTPEEAGTPTLTVEPTPSQEREQRSTRGIDASHHQGDIGWRQVADHGISFAYLKATEGHSFADPEFTTNWHDARQAGVRTGGYHYYTLCSPPEPQADHFVSVLDSVPGEDALPPVVDLELIGNCDPPPERGALLADVRAFVDRVENATAAKVVVYFHPDFEAHYGMVDDLDRRLWVRRVGDQPPPGDWWMWQRNDQGRVPGIEGPVDLNVLR